MTQTGCGTDWFKAHNYGLFDFQHHLVYATEIRIGEQVSTYNRVLDKNTKRFHGMYFIVNDSRDQLACTLEYITAGVDLITRKTADFPAELDLGMEKLLSQHRSLNWEQPLCGAMQV
jgi:acyl-CoA thioester hydrolase